METSAAKTLKVLFFAAAGLDLKMMACLGSLSSVKPTLWNLDDSLVMRITRKTVLKKTVPHRLALESCFAHFFTLFNYVAPVFYSEALCDICSRCYR